VCSRAERHSQRINRDATGRARGGPGCGGRGGEHVLFLQLPKHMRAAVKNVRLGEADGLKNFHPQKWVPNAMK